MDRSFHPIVCLAAQPSFQTRRFVTRIQPANKTKSPPTHHFAFFVVHVRLQQNIQTTTPLVSDLRLSLVIKFASPTHLHFYDGREGIFETVFAIEQLWAVRIFLDYDPLPYVSREPKFENLCLIFSPFLLLGALLGLKLLYWILDLNIPTLLLVVSENFMFTANSIPVSSRRKSWRNTSWWQLF